MPAGPRLVHVIELVEAAVAAVDDQHVRVGAALDLRVLRDRVADVVGFGAVPIERHVLSPLRAADDVDRDAVPLVGAEVGVHDVAAPDRVDHGAGVSGGGQRIDALVPHVRLRKDRAARRTGEGRGTRPGHEQRARAGRESARNERGAYQNATPHTRKVSGFTAS